MLKYKSFLYLSIGVSTVFFLLIANAQLNEKSFIVSSRIMATANNKIKESTKCNKNTIQPILDKNPKFKEPINYGIDAITEEVNRVEEVINDIEKQAFVYTYTEQVEIDINQSFKKQEGFKTLHQTLENAERELRLIYEQTVFDLNKSTVKVISDSLVLAVTKSIPKLDLLDRFKVLEGCSPLLAQMTFSAMKLDFQNLKNIYTNEIIKFVPVKDRRKYHPKVVVNQKRGILNKGDVFEAYIQLGSHIRSTGEGGYFEVNGQKVYPDKNGMGDYEVIPKRKGKHKLHLTQYIINSLTGEKYTSSSEFEYYVIE